MRLSLLCVLVAVLAGSAQAGLTQEEKDLLLAQHNAYRAMELEAANIEYMTWNTALEAFAQEAADLCQGDHTSSNARSNIPGFTGYAGENIWSSSAPNVPYIQSVVRSWWSEIHDYDYDTNSCAPGKVCGHYTQVVWSSSKELGCGKAYCPNLQSYSNGGTLVFCVYGKGGNWQGVKPYTHGEQCSDCPESSPVCGRESSTHLWLCFPSEEAANSAPAERPIYDTANDFCHAVSGPNSFICTGETGTGDDACQTIYCAANGDPAQCEPFDASGTEFVPCGEGQRCLGGICNDDTSEASDGLPAGCPHGDQDLVSSGGSSTTCSAVVSGDCDCTAQTFGGQCCQTCSPYAANRDPNCTDHPGVDCNRYASWICSSSTYRSWCCNFCRCS